MGEMQRFGRIEVVCGSMFSGKTEELIRRMKRAVFAHQKVMIFKPAIDTRYDVENVVSHDRNSIQSTAVEKAITILEQATNIDLVGIDEAQFFDNVIVKVCNTWLTKACALSWLALTWTLRGCPSDPCPPSAPLPTM